QGSPRSTQGERQWRELSEGWTVRHEDREHPIRIGESWESVLGIDFDGTATYATKQAVAPRAGGGRVVLEIDGAATHAIVWCDGQQVAEHLGGWTPFRCDITDLVNERDPSSDNSNAPRQLRFEIQVDE